MAEAHPFLNYGDLIVLWCEGSAELQVEGDAGFLCRRGSLDGGIAINQAQFTQAPRSGIRECVFRLCRPFGYAAKQEYEDYLMRLEATDTSSFTADEIAKFDEKQALLLEKMAKEQAVNVAESKKYFGEPVKFGDTIQLQHWISGDFIDVAGGTIADLEPSAIKLVLTEAGSQCSHLTISPMHKIRRVGHPVALDDDVIFRVQGTEHEHYLHATFSVSPTHSSTAASTNGKAGASNTSVTGSMLVPAGEGNCYFEPSAFRIRRFDTSWETSDSVSVGTVIQLIHPDSDTCLRVFPTSRVPRGGGTSGKTKHKRSSEEGKVRGVVKDPPTPKQKKHSKHGSSKSSSKKSSSKKSSSKKVPALERSEVVPNLASSLENGDTGDLSERDTHFDFVRSCELDTPSVPPVSSLWILESETAVVGGIVDWSLRFRLKNFETHNYLRYVCDSVPQLQGRKPVCPERLTTCDKPSVGTVFGFRPASSGQSVTVDVDFGVQLVPLEFLGDDPKLSKSEKARLRSLIGITVLPGDPDPSEVQFNTPSTSKKTKKRRKSKNQWSQNHGGSSLAGSAVTIAAPDDSLQLFVTTKTEMPDAFLVRPLSLQALRPYDTCLELLARLDKHAAVILDGLTTVVHTTDEQSHNARSATSQNSQIRHALDGFGRALVWLHVFQYGDGGQSLKDNHINVENTESVLTIADDPRFTWPCNALSARRQLILCDMGHEVIMKRQEQLVALMQAIRRHHSRDPTIMRRAADFAEQLRRLCNLNYSLVTVMCQGGNTHCRNILQQHVSTMATHALDEVGAYDAMKEILRDNVHMLIKNPDLESQIRFMAGNLRDFGFVPDCLEFLEVLCICNDVAITENQTSIVHHVVERGAPYLVRFHLNTEQQDHRAPKLDGSPDYPCYPGQSIGPDLLERKHPILIGWITNENAATRDEPGFISMRDLFPKNKIMHKKLKGMGQRKSSALLTGATTATHSKTQEVATPTEWVTLTYFVKQVVEAAHLANDQSGNDFEEESSKAHANHREHSSNSSVDGAKSRLPHHEQILTMYSFAVTQLRLLSKCCEERNYLGIKMLQDEFTVELLLTGLHDSRIPCELRECFAQLLNTIHVDVAPFRSVNVPSRTYIVYDQRENRGDVVHGNTSVGAPSHGGATDALAVPEPYKFSVVQLVLLSIFSDLDEADNDTLFTFVPQVKGTGREQNQQRLNSFIESILMLVKQLIHFGFFSSAQTPGLLEIVLEQLEKFSLTEPRLNTKKLSSRSRSFQQLDVEPTKNRRVGQDKHNSKIHPMTVIEVDVNDDQNTNGSIGEDVDDVSMANGNDSDGSTNRRLGPLLSSCIGFLAAVAMLIFAFYFRNHKNHINDEAFLDAPVYNSQLIALVILFADYTRVIMFWNQDNFFGWRAGIKLSLMGFLLLDIFHYIFFSMVPEGVIFYRFVRLVVYVMLIAFYALKGCDKTADAVNSEEKNFRAVEYSDNGPSGRQDDGKRMEKMHLLEVLEAVMRFRQQESVSEIVHGICNVHEQSATGVLVNNKIGIIDDRCSRIVNSTLAKCNRDPYGPRILGVCQGFLQWADPDVVAGAVKAMDSLLTSAQFVVRCVNNCTVLTKSDEILVFKKLRDDFWGLCDLVEQFELFVGRQVALARTEFFFNKVHARISSIMYADSLVGIEDLDSEYLFDELNKIHIGMGHTSASLRALVGRLYDLFSCIVAASPAVSARFFHLACEEEFVRIIGYSPGATQLLLEVVEGNTHQNKLLPTKVLLSCARALDYSVKQAIRNQRDMRLTTFDAEGDLTNGRASGLGQFERWEGLELAREQLAVMHIFMLLQINDDVTGARQLEVLRALCQTRTTELRRVVHRLKEPMNITTSLVDTDHEKHYHRLASLKRGPLSARTPKDRGVWAAHVECSLQSRLLYTLAFSCSGSSTLIQSKIESIMHFQRAVNWILSTQTHWNLKSACFVFLRYTARENLLGVDYTSILESLMGVVSTLLKYANEACQASHTFDVLRTLRHQKQLRDDFMEHEPPISNSNLFVGDDYENVLLFRISAMHALPLLTSVCTNMTARHKSELRVRLRDLQGKVARLVDWSQRNGYDYTTQHPVIGTAGASVSGVSDFELFACRTRELHDVLTARLGPTNTTSALQSPVVGQSLSLSSSTKSNGSEFRRRSSFSRPSISNLRSRRQSKRQTEMDSTMARDVFVRKQQAAQVAVASGDNTFKMYNTLHRLARTRPTDFGVVIRNVMSILRQCTVGSSNSLTSPEVRTSNIKRWSAEHNDSLTAGGTRTPRQVVALLLRSLLLPSKDRAFINAESFDDIVGRRATLDAQDETSEEMRLQLLYVGALETALQLYGLFTDDPLGLASLKLAVMLMSRTPSPRSKHQDIMLHFLQSDVSTGFLTRVEGFLNEYTQRVRNHWLLAMFAGGVTTAATEEMKFLLQLLRLSCLSKHSGNQRILRTRVGRDGTSFNILKSMVNLFAALAQSCDLTTADPARCESELKLAIVVAVTLEDMVVGPCLQNQRALAFSTPLLHVVNQVFRTRVYFDDYGDVIRRFPESTSVSMADNNRMVDLIRDLQTSCISLVKAVLEGRPDVDVHQRVCETVELHLLLQPLARTHSIILKHEKGNDRTPRVARGGYSRTHSSELEFGCSLMDLLLRLKAADPEWWRKHLDDPALERNLAAGTYSPEEVAAFRYFGSMLLHVDVLWKIYDVGGGAGESIALPVARPHMTMSEQLVFNEELAKYVASQTPRYLQQRFYFMKPTIAFFTGTSAVAKYLQDKLVRDSRETKLRSLLDESAFLYTRLKIQRAVFEASQGMRLFSTNMMMIMESIAFWTGAGINFLLIVSLEHSSGVGGINSMITADVHQTYNMKLAPFFAASTEGLTENIIGSMLDVLIIISMVAYGLAVVLRIVNVSLPYGMRRPHGSAGAYSGSPGASADDSSSDDDTLNDSPVQRGGSPRAPMAFELALSTGNTSDEEDAAVQKARACWRTIQNSVKLTPTRENASIVLYLALMCCGIAYIIGRGDNGNMSPVLMSLTLLQFFLRNSYIGLVLEAVTSTLQQLAYTLIGMVIIMYIFAVVAFNYFATDFEDGQCLEMWSCLLEVLNFGMRNGGGIGDTLRVYNSYTQTFLWVGHSFFDWLFFIIINVIFLNVVFGIIVDQFAELRDQRKERDNDIANCCPICGTDVSDDSEGDHLKEHSLANYMYFLIHLDDESTVFNRVGVESYICNALANDLTAIDWFPRGDGSDRDSDDDGGGRDDSGNDQDNRVSKHLPAAPPESRNGDDFDLEETLERQERTIDTLRNTVELLREQNESVKTSLSELQQSMSRLLEARDTTPETE